jgi:hypothetical protein
LKSVTAILLIAAAALPAAASEPAAPRRAPEARETRDPRAQREAPELICRSVEIAATGETPMVCMTAADWRRAEQ